MDRILGIVWRIALAVLLGVLALVLVLALLVLGWGAISWSYGKLYGPADVPAVVDCDGTKPAPPAGAAAAPAASAPAPTPTPPTPVTVPSAPEETPREKALRKEAEDAKKALEGLQAEKAEKEAAAVKEKEESEKRKEELRSVLKDEKLTEIPAQVGALRTDVDKLTKDVSDLKAGQERQAGEIAGLNNRQSATEARHNRPADPIRVEGKVEVEVKNAAVQPQPVSPSSEREQYRDLLREEMKGFKLEEASERKLLEGRMERRLEKVEAENEKTREEVKEVKEDVKDLKAAAAAERDAKLLAVIQELRNTLTRPEFGGADVVPTAPPDDLRRASAGKYTYTPVFRRYFNYQVWCFGPSPAGTFTYYVNAIPKGCPDMSLPDTGPELAPPRR